MIDTLRERRDAMAQEDFSKCAQSIKSHTEFLLAWGYGFDRGYQVRTEYIERAARRIAEEETAKETAHRELAVKYLAGRVHAILLEEFGRHPGPTPQSG